MATSPPVAPRRPLDRRRRSPLLCLCLGLLLSSHAAADTFIVNNNADTGTGSLRWAIDQANGRAGADIIVLDAALAGQTISIGSPLAPIAGDVTISGSAAAGVAVTGNNQQRVFFAQSGTIVIEAVTIRDGRARGGAGASGGGGGLGAGGAVFVNKDANVSLIDVKMIGNAAVGGDGGSVSGDVRNGGGGGLGAPAGRAARGLSAT